MKNSGTNKLDKKNVETILPLTPLQEGMLFHYQHDPESSQYVEQLRLEITGDIDFERFKKAWEITVSNNETLRTVFRWEKLEKPLQIVLKQCPPEFKRFDLTGFPEEKQKIELDRIQQAEVKQGIDLTSETLRINLCELVADRFEISICNHHILYDGWSNGILLTEFFGYYKTCCEGKQPRPIPKNRFGNFIQYLKQQNPEKRKRFWQECLGGVENATPLPVQREKKEPLRNAKKHIHAIKPELAAKIEQFVKEKKVTQATLFNTAWGLLLQRYANSDDVVFGVTSSGRTAKVPGIDQIVGLFINTLPFRVTVDENETVTELFQKLEQQALDRQEHEHTPLTDCKQYIAFPQQESLFDSIVVVENYPLDQKLNGIGGLKVAGYSTTEMTNFDLTLAITVFDQINLNLIYNEQLFDSATIETMAGHFERILIQFLEKSDQKVAELDLLTEQEKETILNKWNQNDTNYPSEKSLQEIFEEQVTLYPEKIALSFQGRTLTYSQLNEEANRLAHWLRSQGVTTNSAVALMLDRSIEMMVGIMAILKAGGSYLPIALEYPKERIQYMLDDANVKLALTTPNFFPLFEGAGLDVFDINDRSIRSEEKTNPERINQSKDIAYIIYTSGSTGQPKGVLTRHFNVSRVVKDCGYMEIKPEDTLLQLSSYAFDGSVFDIFGALLNGARLQLLEKEKLLNIDDLANTIREESVSVFFITTALFNTLVDHNLTALKGVRKILFGGERVSTSHVKKALTALGPDKMIHVYGPTETTVFATAWPIDRVESDATTIPIGKAIANTELYVLDAQLRPQPIEAPGELYISGKGVANGYLGQAKLTAGRFIPNPWIEDSTLYKTGDLVRWNREGEIEFLDRIDTQVKIRGLRIELGEIEAAILTVAGVREALVSVRKDERGQSDLVCHIVTDSEITEKALKQELEGTLPTYMIPVDFCFLDAMPLGLTGKIDKRALPEIRKGDDTKREYIAPTNEVEKTLQAIWQKELGIEKIGISDNFFELGGHSLNGTVIVAQIHKHLGVKLPLKTFFANGTIQEIARVIELGDKAELPQIPKAEPKESSPVTWMQKGLFVQELFENIGTSYHIPIAIEVNGKLDADRVEQTFQKLIATREILRTTFHQEGEEIVQQVVDRVDFTLERKTVDPDELDETIRAFVRPFDLGQAPLIRTGLFDLSEQRQIVMMDLHHIIMDGVSVQLLIEEFIELYAGKEPKAEELQFRDYTAWLDQRLKSGALEPQKKFWQETLSGELPVSDFPMDFPRSEERTFDGETFSFHLSEQLTKNLKKVAAERKITLNSLLLSIYSIILYKYTGQEDLIVGSLVAGREHPDLERVMGMFNNFLPIRLRLNSEKSVQELLGKHHETLLAAYEHQEYPYGKMLEDLGGQFDRSRNPLFDTMLIYHNQLETFQLEGPEGVRFSNYDLRSNTSKLDLKLDIYNHEFGGLNCVIEYNHALFLRERMERLAGHFEQLATVIAKSTDQKLKELSLLTEREERLLRVEFNQTDFPYPADKTLHELFEEKVTETPNAVAVVYGSDQLTFAELNERANQLAVRLIKEGIQPDDLVAVVLYRSIEMSVFIFAILKAGGAYLPISPDYPNDRIRFIMEDSGAKLLLTDDASMKKQFESLNVLNGCEPEIYCDKATNPERGVKPDNLAYVIYTSGSTGKPKGVMIEHHAAVNRLHWMQRKYPIAADDAILQKTPFTFDVSVWEMFWWAIEGARLCYLAPEAEKDPGAIIEAIEQYSITTMHFVPSMLSAFLDRIDMLENLNALKTLKQVFASGEALPLKLVQRFNNTLYKANGTQLFNLYGPTEATVDVSWFDCSTEEELTKVPIGKPIDNIQLHVLDRDGQIQPIGVPGELHIAGVGLARGYLNRKELTDEKFISNPFDPGKKLYKTGDLTRWMADGNIEFLGRIDHQVKIRGLRIELGEIEETLQKYGAVREAVVMAKEDEHRGAWIGAWLVTDRDVTVSEYREYLAKTLPDYMIPSFFTAMEKMPLSPNGKVDRKQLPEPAGVIQTGTEYIAPETDVEKRLHTLWKELLKVDSFGVLDSFFELGGHSLMATQLLGRVQQEFRITIPLREIFNKNSIRALAALIEGKESDDSGRIEPIEKQKRYAVSSAQKRLFILDQLEEGSTAYNLPTVLKISGEVDKDRFESTMRRIIERHESLRTHFIHEDGEPWQVVQDSIDFNMEFETTTAEKIEETVLTFIRPFDLEKAPLLRVKLVATGVNESLLLFDMHHAVSDGFSSVVLVREFLELYKGETLPELRIQYKDYSDWQNRFFESEAIKKQEEYWLNLFQEEPPVLNLPTDFNRPPIRSMEGRKIAFQFDRELSEQLKQLALNQGATLYMVLLGLYNALLYKYTGHEEIVVGSPTANRSDREVEGLIGMFVNTLALKNSPKGEQSFTDFLKALKGNLFDAFENQDYQFESLVEKLNLKRDLSRNPLFDTMFVLQNMTVPAMDVEGLKFEPYPFENNISRFDLLLEANETKEGLQFQLEYSTELFREETVQKLANHFERITRQILKNPAGLLKELELITPDEQELVVNQFNQTDYPFPGEKTIQLRFEEQVAKNPDRVAITFEGESLTYGELNQKANRLARTLRTMGVERDQIVAIQMERALEMQIALFAVLKAGGAYLPISTENPTDRTRYILEDSNAKLLLVHGKSDVSYDNVSILDLADPSIYHEEDDNLPTVNSSRDLAYVIYTSGSTGNPKGVMIEHRSLINRLHWMQRKYPIGEGDVILQKTPYTFDVSLWELFWWSFEGASLCFLKPGGEKDPSEIVAAIEQEKITTMHFVPSMLALFLDWVEAMDDLTPLASLRQVFASGEALLMSHVERFNKTLQAENGTGLHNLYGPTEATVDVSWFDCQDMEGWQQVPIGKPVDNTQLYVLNEWNQPQPIGVVGELHIAGVNLARGYLNRPELTDEKFVQNPFDANGKMYKTGDLARWLPDGNIEYQGRIDHQVKIRGLRIELGEIESALGQYPEVKEVAVLAQKNKSGDDYLCAWIVADKESTVAEYREFLVQKLPDYMVPAYFIHLEEMPLSANGKLDRKQLPEPESQINTGVEYQAPAGELEQELTEIWEKALAVERVGVNDNFFDLGGNSLLLIRVHKELEQRYPKRTKITDLFTWPTITQLANFLANHQEKRELPIKTVKMPEAFFSNSGNTGAASIFRFAIEGDLFLKVKQLADGEDAEQTMVMFAVFAYLLAQLGGNTSLTIQAVLEEKNRAASIDFDLTKIEKFADLVRFAKDNGQKSLEAESLSYEIKECSDFSLVKNGPELVPLFVQKNLLSASSTTLNLFDLRLAIEEKSNAMHVELEFNGKRLKKEKMKELVQNFLKLTQIVTTQYANENR